MIKSQNKKQKEINSPEKTIECNKNQIYPENKNLRDLNKNIDTKNYFKSSIDFDHIHPNETDKINIQKTFDLGSVEESINETTQNFSKEGKLENEENLKSLQADKIIDNLIFKNKTLSAFSFA